MKYVLAFMLCLFAAPMFGATYYIANGAGVTCSDANTSTQAQVNTTPWCHSPDMQGTTGVASSYTPVAGDTFVFRGCDTWTAGGSVFVNVSQSGSVGNYITFGGTDQTWYNSTVCSSGWDRPIFSGGGTWPGTGANNKFFATPGSHVQIDWIEFTNTNVTGAGYVTSIDPNVGADIQIHDNYWHGMSASSLTGSSAMTAASSNSCGAGGSFHDNYVDMSDSSAYAQGVWQGVFLGCNMDLYRNYFSNLMTCANGNFRTVHDNWFNNCGLSATANGLHANNFESNGDATGGSLYYNNLTTNVQGASPVQFQVGPPTGSTSYIFNNVTVNAATSSTFFSCSNGISAIQGTCHAFNNTVECGNDSGPSAACLENGDKGPPNPTFNSFYNHYITSQTGSGLFQLANGSSITDTGSIAQTKVVANGQGYTAASSFSPTAAGTATIGTGGAASTMLGYCTSISSIDSASGIACQSDTTKGVAINTTTHQVTGFARTPILRPTSGTWDSGAYQFSSASKPALTPAFVALLRF